MITLQKRKYRYIKAIKNQTHKSLSTLNPLVKYMNNSPIKSLTLNNDITFAKYTEMENYKSIIIDFLSDYH